MTPAEVLHLVDELRARGAVEVEVADVKARFAGPMSAPVEKLEPAAQKEYEERRAKSRAGRSEEDRLLRPLGILKREGS